MKKEEFNLNFLIKYLKPFAFLLTFIIALIGMVGYFVSSKEVAELKQLIVIFDHHLDAVEQCKTDCSVEMQEKIEHMTRDIRDLEGKSAAESLKNESDIDTLKLREFERTDKERRER